MKISEILELEDKKSKIEVRPSHHSDYIEISIENYLSVTTVILSKTEAILLADCLSRKAGDIK